MAQQKRLLCRERTKEGRANRRLVVIPSRCNRIHQGFFWLKSPTYTHPGNCHSIASISPQQSPISLLTNCPIFYLISLLSNWHSLLSRFASLFPLPSFPHMWIIFFSYSLVMSPFSRLVAIASRQLLQFSGKQKERCPVAVCSFRPCKPPHAQRHAPFWSELLRVKPALLERLQSSDSILTLRRTNQSSLTLTDRVIDNGPVRKRKFSPFQLAKLVHAVPLLLFTFILLFSIFLYSSGFEVLSTNLS